MITSSRWNASVCKRRLRPLASKITTFQKRLREAYMRRAGERRAGIDPLYPHGKQHAALSSSVTKESPNTDPAWVLQQSAEKKRRRTRVKYRAAQQNSSATSQKNSRLEAREEISLATPYLQRNPPHGSHFPSSPAWRDNADFTEENQQSPASNPHLVRRCFLELMLGTCTPQMSERADENPLQLLALSRPGACSLMKMCLRQMPAHMMDEQYYRLSLNPDDDSDVYDETYEDLGRFDADTGLQNQILRRVVRAHAVQMYLSLLDDPTLTAKTIHDLLTPKILAVLTTAEIETMLLTWMRATLATETTAPNHPYFQRRYLPEPYQLLSRMQYHLRIKDPTLTYRVLTELIASGSLKVEEIGHSSLRKVWRGALKSIAMESNDSLAAMALVETALVVAAGVCPNMAMKHIAENSLDPSTYFLHNQLDWANIDFDDAQEQCYTALANTVSSLCTLLAATTMVRRRNCPFAPILEDGNLEHSLRPLRSAAAVISKAYRSHTFASKARKTGFPLPAAIIVLADLQIIRKEVGLELSQDQESAQEQRVWMLQKLRKLAGSYVFAASEVDAQLAELLHAISKCLSRATPPFYEEALFIPHQPTITRESAKDYAGTVKRLLEMEGRAFRKEGFYSPFIRIAEAQRQAQRTRNGFRWEEGLEEWVSMTPAFPAATRGLTEGSSPLGNRGQIPKTSGSGRPLRKKSGNHGLQSSHKELSSDDMMQTSSQTSLPSSPPICDFSDPPIKIEDTEDELAGLESPSMFRAPTAKRQAPCDTPLRQARRRRV